MRRAVSGPSGFRSGTIRDALTQPLPRTQQIECIRQVGLRAHPKTDPGRWTEHMVGVRETADHHAFGAFARETHIQQAIPMQVRKFEPVAREANSAEAMAARSDAGELERPNFQRFHCGELLAVQQRRPHQQERVENLRRQRHSRQPAQTPDDELEDHGRVSARPLMCRTTRKCTAWNTSCVHQSKYHAGRTCREYHVRPMSVVVPSPLSWSSNCPRCASR